MQVRWTFKLVHFTNLVNYIYGLIVKENILI
jgi:hypothetical protein